MTFAATPLLMQRTLCLNQPNIAVKITSIMKCQAKQAADKTVGGVDNSPVAQKKKKKKKRPKAGTIIII